MVKKKPAYMPSRNKKNEANKKAIIWIASVLTFIVVVVAVLLILDNVY